MPRLASALPAILEVAGGPHDDPGASSRLRGLSRAEMVISVFLAEVLDARGFVRMLDALRDAGLLDPAALAAADHTELAALIPGRASAAPPKWLSTLSRLADWSAAHVEDLDTAPTELLREELLALRGVGPATADTILLRALGRPIAPVDRGTYRVLVRHGWIDPTAEYDEARDAIESGSAGGDLGALVSGLQRIGAEFCRATVPRCERCPLRPFLPESGPISPDP